MATLHKKQGGKKQRNHAEHVERETPAPKTIQEYLDFYGWSQRDLACCTGLTQKTISEICNGPITLPAALVLSCLRK